MSLMEKIRKFTGVTGEQDVDEMEYEDSVEINEEDKFEQKAPAKKEKAQVSSNKSKLQVVLEKPETFEDARDIADNLISKKTVILNIENVDKETSRRLIDFLSGVAYAQGGNIKRVANRTYVITPYNVDILGEVLETINADGFEF